MSVRYSRTASTVLVVLFAWFIWPTPYQYLTGPRSPILGVRINRFTGAVDWLMPYGGWRGAGGADFTSDAVLAFVLVAVVALGVVMLGSAVWRHMRPRAAAANADASESPSGVNSAADAGRFSRDRPFYRLRMILAFIIDPSRIDRLRPPVPESDRRELRRLVLTLWDRDTAQGYDKKQWQRLTDLLEKLGGF